MSETIKPIPRFKQMVTRTRLGVLLTAFAQAAAIILFALYAISKADLISSFVVPCFLGLTYLASGLWVFLLRRMDETGRVFSLFAASAGITTVGFLDANTVNNMTYLWSFSMPFTVGTLIHLTLIFPSELNFIKKQPRLRWLGYIGTLSLLIIPIRSLFNFNQPTWNNINWNLGAILLILAVLLSLLSNLYRSLRSPNPLVQQHSVILLWGMTLSFLPFTIWFLLDQLSTFDFSFSGFLILPLVIFPVAGAYSILHNQLINTDYILRQGILYGFLSILITAGYSFLVSGFSLLFGSIAAAETPLITGFTVFLLALIFNPLRSLLNSLITQIFFRGQKVYDDLLQEFSRSINPSMELKEIGAAIRRFVNQSLQPTYLHLFVLDALREQYIAIPDNSGKPTTDIRFSVNSVLPQLLSRDTNYLFLESNQIPEPLLPEKGRISLLDSQLFIPLQSKQKNLSGFLALASKKSGDAYSNADLNLLISLCDQASMAVERAQVLADLERHIQEMNVLTRVAQGINITLQFDDMLELIYAQATRIIPSSDFSILLYNRDYRYYFYAFYLEDDHRSLEKENKPLAEGSDLAMEIIKTGQGLITENLVMTAREYGIHHRVSGIYSWAGVPLNAGAETIGALSLGSRDPNVIFAEDQIDLLQAIADLAAGAIIKAQLMAESEQSARQLTLLNEVSRNLTSTLDLSNLLDQILESAVDIIGCEAGALFLLDDESGDLIFEVVKGPIAKELLRTRLSPSTSYLGRAVNTSSAVILNNAHQIEEWFKESGKLTGFQTRDLLIVPMLVQNRVVGVIELINKQDGLPFNQENQDLLTAFASQASIALENARLYTLTDQELADRVDELSVMQQIDRELNASLDISRAMQITLDWAMRRSGADAGLVGAVTENGLDVMADQGYSSELEPYKNSFLPIKIPGIRDALEEEQTQQFHRSILEKPDPESFNLLSDAQSQIVIPIRREDKVIGLLMLESLKDNPLSSGIQEFLSRLSDHAAIAIANAKLFSQVQDANLAKSEFVSFVSHELKTPMTSIRGYTDLLLGNAVGEVNEIQENFLDTIRTNVIRMATLVSDLTDVSRIEAGRLKLEYAAVAIRDVFNEVARAQAKSLEDKNQELVMKIPEQISPAWGDYTRIVQVLTNLVSNANKYTPEGGTITITASKSVNQWDPDGAPDVLLVSVRDNGIGIKEEDRDQIFTKFFRSADPHAREVPGTGLGLNITRNLIEMQGGKIWFESEYGAGTTFYFTIPIANV